MNTKYIGLGNAHRKLLEMRALIVMEVAHAPAMAPLVDAMNVSLAGSNVSSLRLVLW